MRLFGRRDRDLLAEPISLIVDALDEGFYAVGTAPPGSSWRADLDALPAAEGRVIQVGLNAASMASMAPLEQLAGLQQLLLLGGHRYPARMSAATLARSVLEVSATLQWLFEDDLDPDVRRDRAAAWLLDDLRSFRNYVEALSVPYAEEDGRLWCRYLEEFGDLLTLLNDAGVTTRVDSPVRDHIPAVTAVGGVRRPSHSEALANFGMWNGKRYYREASAYAHGAPWVLRRGSVLLGRDASGTPHLRLVETGPRVSTSAALALLAVVDISTRMIWYKGILDQRLVELGDEVFAAIRASAG